MERADDLIGAAQRWEVHSRRLDSTPRELSAWLAQLADFSADYLTRNESGPAFLADGSGSSPSSGIPLEPAALAAVLTEFNELVLTRGIVPTSGRFFGYVPGGGLASAAVGDYLAALTNRYAGVYAASPGAAEVENSSIRWLIDMVGYPDGAWGTLQSGGSLATLTALVAARESRPPERWPGGVIYQTDECHVAIRKSLHIVGLGDLPVRSVAVDDEFRMSVADLAHQVEEDRRRGLEPWMVFASAGTVNTGAIDPLEEIADLAGHTGLWLHVDGAYGGFFILTERVRHRLSAMARADSIVLDPHKGLFLPYGCGAVLVRDGERLRKCFAFTPSYLEDVQGESPSPADYSPELTRHFRGLRLWMSLKLHGLERFRAALEEKLVLARLAQDRLSAIPGIEVGPDPQLSCVAFRVSRSDDAATAALLERLLRRGRVHVSSTRLRGKLYLRLCILCFRSHWDDVQVALDEIEEGVSSL